MRARGRARSGMHSLRYAGRVCGLSWQATRRLADEGWLEPAGHRPDGRVLYRIEDLRKADLVRRENEPTEDFCFRCLEWKPIEDVRDGACSMCRTKHGRAKTLAEAERMKR